MTTRNYQADHDAAIALCVEFDTIIDAAYFIRAETGLSLTESVQAAQREARNNKDTPLGRFYIKLPYTSVWR